MPEAFVTGTDGAVGAALATALEGAGHTLVDGPADVLVNAVRVRGDDYDDVIDANALAPLLTARACVPAMIERGAGLIVNVSSLCVLAAYARDVVAGSDVFAASQWALNGYTQTWARVLAPHGIRVNALCLPADESPATLAAAAGALVALLADDRTGENVPVLPGQRELPPSLPAHRALAGA